jgi:hypothetical protein
VTFSESVTGVTSGNFSLALTGSVSGASIASVSGTGATRTVTVNTGTGNGTIGLNKTSNTGVTDAAGNAMTGGTVTGQTFTIDRGAPTVSSINRAQGDPTNATSRTFTVTFSESVTGVTTSNFSLATTGVTSASISSVSGSGATRTVTVNTGTGNGTIGLNKTSNTGITDTAGNALTGGNVTGQAYTVDKIAPTVSSINRVSATPTNAASVQFLVTFSESVTGVNTARFSLLTTGGVTGASITSVSGSGATRTVTVNTGTGNGTIGLNKTSNTGVADTAGNTLTGGTVTGQTYSIVKP